MGVLQRFERRLEGLVEGTFAKVFKGEVQPVEVAQALQRETDDKRAVVSEGRVLVPNEFVVELGEHDHARFEQYAEALGDELASMVKEHAAENGYTILGPVAVRFERVDSLDTGVFRVRSGVSAGSAAKEQMVRAGGSGADAREAAGGPPPGAKPGTPRLVVGGKEKYDRESPQARGMDEVYFLVQERTVIGRGPEADLQLPDGLVSRKHALIRIEDNSIILEDLGSTNGTLVNSEPVGMRQLVPGDRIAMGETTLVFERDPTD